MPAKMEMTPASVAPTIHFKIRKSESILLNRFSYSAMALAASLALSSEARHANGFALTCSPLLILISFNLLFSIHAPCAGAASKP